MFTFLTLLCIITLLRTSWAGPHFLRSSTVILPNSLPQLPRCATTCVQDFVASTFPRCSQNGESNGLECLCRSSSTFTLGEGILRCLVSSCDTVESRYINTGYRVCSSILDAKVPTHSVLTASIAEPTTISLPNHSQRSKSMNESTKQSTSVSKGRTTSSKASTASVTLESKPSGSMTTKLSQKVSFSGTFGVTKTNAPSTAPTGSTASTTASPSESQVSAAAASASAVPILSTPQIAGIAVAGSVVVVVAFGLLLFLFCIKRRKGNKRDSDASFGLTGNAPAPRIEIHQPDDRHMEAVAASRPKTHRLLGLPSDPAQKRWTLWNNKNKSPEMSIESSPQGHRVLTQESSPISTKSYQTTSRLLPDKPMFKKSTPPKPINFSGPRTMRNGADDTSAGNPGVRLIVPTPPPKSESRNGNASNSQTSFHGSPPSPHSELRRQPSDPFIDKNSDPLAKMYAIERHRASVKDLPRIITPGIHTAGQYLSDSAAARPRRPGPPPHLASLVPAPLNPQSFTSPPSLVAPLLPSPNIRPEQDQPKTMPYTNHGTGKRAQQGQDSDRSRLPSQSFTFNKNKPISSYRQASRRPETYYTTSSETSFEDDPDDSPEPSAAVGTTLSPVAESPASTPLSHIRYPAVPGSSAERKAGASSLAPPIYLDGISSSMTTNSLRLPHARALIELPAKRSSTSPPRSQTGASPQDRQIQVDGAKWQILTRPGLDGRSMEVSGSPSVPQRAQTRDHNTQHTPPEYRVTRGLHGMPRGAWID